MLASIAFLILLIATVSAWSVGRAHRPIALTFTWLTFAEYLLLLPLPSTIKLVATATYPAVLLVACWAALQSRAAPYLNGLMLSIGVVATAVGLAGARFGSFGQMMACLWLVCALAGAPALVNSNAPPTTRSVAILLLVSLVWESVGWLSWANGFAPSYAYARFVSNIAFAIIVGVQLNASIEWRARWARLRISEQPLIRGWARTWSQSEPNDLEKTQEPEPSSTT